MKKYDVILLTDSRYVNPSEVDWYIQQVLDEDGLVQNALEELGLKTLRTNWDNPNIDWRDTKCALFRTTWDYFHRFEEFEEWLNKVNSQTNLFNSKELIYWNLHKGYLFDLEKKGIRIPPSLLIKKHNNNNLPNNLSSYCNKTNWKEFILKPAVSGAARHTYRFKRVDLEQYNDVFNKLILNEDMILQEFQNKIISKGEIALMFMGGEYTHSVLKKAKSCDFRVQDDFGGSVHHYEASDDEIKFARKIVHACSPIPAYARVDLMWDNHNQSCLSELELIEPELWFRNNPEAAKLLAKAIFNKLQCLD